MSDDTSTGTSEAGSTTTADGEGVTVSMMSEGTKEAATTEATGGKIDVKSLLGDELSKDRNLTKFLDNENPVQAMAKSLLEAQKLAGRVKVGVPGEQSTPEERTAFFKELGVPEAPEGYEFTKPEGLPDEAWDADNAAKWSKLMKDNNVPKAAAAALRQELFNETIGKVTAANESLNKALDASFGEKKMEVAKEVSAMMKAAIPDDATRKTIDAAISDKDRPAFALALGHVMQHMKKTYGLSDNNTNDGGDNSGKSKDELRNEAQKLMASPAYRDGMHKDHASAVKQVNEMYKVIGGITDNTKK